MRLLVNTRSKHPIPPEMMIGLLDAMSAWADRHTKSGKIERIWGSAGVPGGGGIVNVDSLEEFHAIMAEFPFGPFSEIEVIPIVELNTALATVRQAVQQMTGGR